MIKNAPSFIYFDLDDTLLNHKKAEENGLRDVHKQLTELEAIPQLQESCKIVRNSSTNFFQSLYLVE